MNSWMKLLMSRLETVGPYNQHFRGETLVVFIILFIIPCAAYGASTAVEFWCFSPLSCFFLKAQMADYPVPFLAFATPPTLTNVKFVPNLVMTPCTKIYLCSAGTLTLSPCRKSAFSCFCFRSASTCLFALKRCALIRLFCKWYWQRVWWREHDCCGCCTPRFVKYIAPPRWVLFFVWFRRILGCTVCKRTLVSRDFALWGHGTKKRGYVRALHLISLQHIHFLMNIHKNP